MSDEPRDAKGDRDREQGVEDELRRQTGEHQPDDQADLGRSSQSVKKYEPGITSENRIDSLENDNKAGNAKLNQVVAEVERNRDLINR